jgi:hypothetical protein
MKQITNRALRTSGILDVLLVLCLILAPASVHASELTEQEVGAALQTWVRHVTADAKPDAVIERMEPHQVKGETVAYIAHLEGGGFCLCGADDLVLPVYFYSPRGTYDSQNPNYQYILWEIGARLTTLQKGLEDGDQKLQPYQQARSERATFWQELIAGRVPARVEGRESPPTEPISMTLNRTSRWDQISPYNDHCPELTPSADEHVFVGCNAVATSQIMYYWQWPTTGLGTDSVIYYYRWRSGWDSEPLATDPGISGDYSGRLRYDSVGHTLQMNGYWDNSIYGSAQGISDSTAYQNALAALWSRMTQATKTPYADFRATTYNWGVIQGTHADPPDAGDAEVAKLNAHVAIAVDTTFGLWGSNSFFGNDVDGLEDHFRYDPDATFGTTPDIYSLTEDIQWLRPAGLGGDRSDGAGHAWVVSGYNTGTDPNREFWMNMGWGGKSDGWYTLDSAPFPLNHGTMTRIAPLDMTKFVGGGVAGDGSPNEPYLGIEQAIAGAPDGATLIFKAGSTNTFSGDPLVINRPFTLRGYNVIIQKE